MTADPTTIDRHTVAVRLHEQTDLCLTEIASIVDRSIPWCEQAVLLGECDA